VPCLRAFAVALVLLWCLAFPRGLGAQSALINGDRVLVGTLNYCDATGSTGDAYACSLTPAITAYIPAARYFFKASSANVGPATLNLNGLGAIALVKVVGGVSTALADNDILTGQYVEVVYDATGPSMQVLSPLNGATVASVYFPAGSMEVEGGCAVNAAAALVTTGPKVTTIGCTDADTDGIAFDAIMPDSWNAGTITLELAAFSIGNNNSEVLEMRFSGQCIRDNDAVAAWSVTSGSTATSSTNVAASITWGNAANREQHATTAALTLGGTCGAGSHVYLHGYVSATPTTLSPMTDLKLLGVKVEYGRSGSD